MSIHMKNLLGIGTDIVEVKRIEAALGKHGDAFLNKLFTTFEILNIQKRKENPLHVAGRFACKEAIAKALGTGFGKELKWIDIEISNDEKGAPKATLVHKNDISIYISISHTSDYAIAYAMVFKKH